MRIVIFLFVLLQCAVAKKKAAKNFRVSSEISTGWTFCRNQALYYSDFLYKTTVINSGLFWKFIREIPTDTNIATVQDDNKLLLKQLHKHVPRNSELLRLLKVNAEMDFSAPRFEAVAHAQAEKSFPDCQTFLEYSKGQFVCTVEELMAKELGPGNLLSESFDYVYLVEKRLPLIRIYTIPGAAGFSDIFDELKRIVDEGAFSLVLQFVPKPAKCPFYQAEVKPVGYGLEFEMKSAQYVVEEALEGQELTAADEVKADSVLEPFAKIGKSENILAKALTSLSKGKMSVDRIAKLSQNLAWTSDAVAKSRPTPGQLEKLKEINPAAALYRVNGFDMSASTLDPFRIIQFMNLFYGRELELQELGYREGTLKKLFQSRYNPDYAEDSIDEAFALYSDAIVYLNDLELDKRYRGLSKSFADYEKISKQPGQFLGKNILTVVVPIEMNRDGAVLLENLSQSINAGFPIRFAILPIVATDKDESIAAGFYARFKQKGLRAGISFLLEALTTGTFEQVTSPEGDELMHEAQRLMKAFSIQSSSHVFAKGHLVPLSQNLLQHLVELYRKEAEWITKKADDSVSDLYKFVLDAKRAVGIRNDLFTDPHLRYNADKYFTVSDIRKLLTFKTYAYVNEETAEHSLWVAGDFSRKDSFYLAIRALNQTRQAEEIRSRIFCTSPMTSVPNRIMVAASGVLYESRESLDIVVQFLEIFYQHYFNGGFDHDRDLERLARKIQKNPVSKRILQLANDLDSPVLQPILAENERFFDLYELDWFSRTLIAINSNAWKLKATECTSIAEDIEAFIERELTRRGARHAQLARDLGHTRIRDHLIVFGMVERKLMNQVDLDLSHMLTPSHKPFPEFDNSIIIGNRDSSIFHVDALFNPFAREGQKFASIMNYLAYTDMFSFRLALITDPGADDPRLVKIYRFVTPDYKNGPIPIAPVVDDEALLALNLDLPSAWMVVTEEANADLDNIRPTKVPHLKVRFALKSLLIEGQVFFEDGKTVPVGKSIESYDVETGFMSDQSTIMANYGYFQLKAQPGRWSLRVLDEKEEFPVVEGGSVQITTFGGAFTHVEIEQQGLPLSGARLRSSPQADINVFSLASGLFYERLLRIMIASVMKQANKSTVKFWLLETTLSPQGRDALEKMAAHYGFQYELMSYKWPFWLNPQNRKHRTIWAYKILFLDVLFPKSLKKIIFVDADQVVRADLQELVDLDLQGHVYAMTPFCNDKPEMEEFRFWERNYWKDHLRDRPYHISALFVVDLGQLRTRQVADLLRSHYQGLSRDPNSLANLDQDLPNNLQHIIPIFSLPQEWLWCETWCSAGTKAKAKTIDLCNNPRTFESKSDQAVRIIPEWKDYNEEVESVVNDALQEGYEHDEL